MNLDDYKTEAEPLEENECAECGVSTENEFCSKECFKNNQL